MSGNKRITIVTQANGDGLKALIGKAEQFERESNGIEVHIEQANGNFEVLNRLQRGEPGDLIHMSESVFAPYLRQGYIMDLMPFLQADTSLFEADFYGGALAGPSFEGKLAALPIDIHVPLIYYRKQSFADAGLPEPVDGWSFEQFLETALRLTKGNRYGFRIGCDIELFEPFVKRGGGSYLSPDGGTAKGYADSEATAKALQGIVDWFRVHRIAPFHVEGGCFNENFAMVYDFTWWLPHILHQHAGEYGVVGLPRSAEGADTNMMYMGGYGISTACQNPEDAWRLLKQLSVPETDRPLSLLPAAKPVALRLGLAESPYWQIALAELDKATQSAFYSSQKWNANRQIINQDLMGWIKDGADIKASLTKWTEMIG